MTHARTAIPQIFTESIRFGINLGHTIIDHDERYEGRPLWLLAYEWKVAFKGALEFGLLPNQAASLRAVLAAAAEYALTHNYGDEADKEDFPQDYAFAHQADEILTFLQDASQVSFSRR